MSEEDDLPYLASDPEWVRKHTEAEDMSDTELIQNALVLRRERVTADSLAAKQDQRDRLKDLISRADLPAGHADRPSAADLREALGDPDDRELRAALDRWDVPA